MLGCNINSVGFTAISTAINSSNSFHWHSLIPDKVTSRKGDLDDNPPSLANNCLTGWVYRRPNTKLVKLQFIKFYQEQDRSTLPKTIELHDYKVFSYQLAIIVYVEQHSINLQVKVIPKLK